MSGRGQWRTFLVSTSARFNDSSRERVMPNTLSYDTRLVAPTHPPSSPETKAL